MSNFAAPLSKLAESGIGVAAAPTAGQGFALDSSGSFPVSISGGGLVPIGTVVDFAGSSDQGNWLVCDGRAINRSTYSALFAAIGTTHGAGDGTNTFNIPDGRGRASIGAGAGSGLTSRTLGATGGEESHVLSVSELAAHDHALQIDGLNRAGSAVAYGGLAATLDAGGGGAGVPVKNTGNNTAHNNMQPFLALNKLIRAT